MKLGLTVNTTDSKWSDALTELAHVCAMSQPGNTQFTSHPFGDLLNQHLHRRHGLSQAKLATGIWQDPAIIAKMCKGQRLSGPQARERVIAIVGWLHEQGALTTRGEANALLQAAGMPGLREDVPAEAALIARLPVPRPPTNLPAPLTRFIGRERGITEIGALLQSHRLVTLTGAGGVGKTRLAIEVARSLLPGGVSGAALRIEAHQPFSDGVWLVELAPLEDPALVPQAVADAVRLPDQPGRAAMDVLIEHLATKRALLMIDNCEHLIESCAIFIDKLLQRCWDLHVLTTSRELLRIPGEVTVRVPSLTVPDAALGETDRAMGAESAQLFIERAHGPRADRVLEPHTRGAIGRICRQLDGIPLAIELAAALASTLTLDEIAAQLEAQIPRLANLSRTAAPRHQTMHSALDWSYRLLKPADQKLLARLSAFVGGWTLEAAETICADEPGAPSETGLGAAAIALGLNALVDASLVMFEDDGDHPRYRLLEPIRQFAAEQLNALGERAAVRRRHAMYQLALAERSWRYRDTPQERFWLDRLNTEHDNLRTALRWAIEEENGDFALRLNVQLGSLWIRRSHAEASLWIDSTLALPWDQNSPEVMRARAHTLDNAGYVALITGDLARAETLFLGGLALFEQLPDQRELATSLRGCGFIALYRGDVARSRQLVERSLNLCQEIGDEKGLAWTYFDLGCLQSAEGDLPGARSTLEAALPELKRHGIAYGTYRAIIRLGAVCWRMRAHAAARSYLREALRFQQETHFSRPVAEPLECAAGLEFEAGQLLRTIRLIGAAQARRDTLDRVVLSHHDQEYQRIVELARAQVEADCWQAEWDAGYAMTIDQAVAYALEGLA